MRRRFPGTLSVKMRTGWDAQNITAPQFARIAAGEGAELLSVHGRTRAQQYTGRADRGIIRQVVEAVPEVPVLANGDILTPGDVFDMLRETGAAGVMIGRGAMGNPWIFEQTLALAQGATPVRPTREERYATIERHIGWIIKAIDDPRPLATNLKKYLFAYSKGMQGSALFRQRTLESNDVDEILTLARSFFLSRDEAAGCEQAARGEAFHHDDEISHRETADSGEGRAA
jgi:tRNA-dihydrouridine synthase B